MNMKIIKQFFLIIGVLIVGLLFDGFIRLIFIVAGGLIGSLFGVHWFWGGLIGYFVYKALHGICDFLDPFFDKKKKKRKSKVIDIEASSKGPSMLVDHEVK